MSTVITPITLIGSKKFASLMSLSRPGRQQASQQPKKKKKSLRVNVGKSKEKEQGETSHLLYRSIPLIINPPTPTSTSTKGGLSPCAAKYSPPPLCEPSDSVSQSATVSTYMLIWLVTMISTSVYLLWLPRDHWYKRYKLVGILSPVNHTGLHQG